MADTREATTPSHSHLFLVRVWREDVGNGRLEWRGHVQHVLTGERHYFRDWTTLCDYLTVTVANDEGG